MGSQKRPEMNTPNLCLFWGTNQLQGRKKIRRIWHTRFDRGRAELPAMYRYYVTELTANRGKHHTNIQQSAQEQRKRVAGKDKKENFSRCPSWSCHLFCWGRRVLVARGLDLHHRVSDPRCLEHNRIVWHQEERLVLELWDRSALKHLTAIFCEYN